MTCNPLVSIVLPSYNGSRYIERAIQSCLHQTYSSIELLLIDDCSTDNTYAIMQKAGANDSRVRIIKNSYNQKLPASLNIGFRNARGDYFTWTSDDNYYSSDAIEILLRTLIDLQADIVYSGMHFIDENDQIFNTRNQKPPTAMLSMNAVGASFLYKKHVDTCLNGYNEDLFLLEDYDFWIRAYVSGFVFKKIDLPLYHYRKHKHSLSIQNELNVHRLTSAYLKSLEKYLPLFPSEEHAGYWYNLYYRTKCGGEGFPFSLFAKVFFLDPVSTIKDLCVDLKKKIYGLLRLSPDNKIPKSYI